MANSERRFGVFAKRWFHEKSKHIMIYVTHDDRMAQYADEVIHFEDMLVKGGEK